MTTSLEAKNDLEDKIQAQAERLQHLNGPEDKRIKKRVLQNLGKLKKQLAETAAKINDSSSSSSSHSHSVTGASNTQENEVSETTESNIYMNKKKAKLKLKIVNGEIASLALKKQLKTATKRFRWLVKKGIQPDVHSYTNLMNAHVRCSDIAGAETLWNEMVLHEIPPNVVTCTTLIKGYCESSSIEKAKSFFLAMMSGLRSCSLPLEVPCQEKERKKRRGNADFTFPLMPLPNTRTLNTLLRGCVRCGAVNVAKEAILAVSQSDNCNDITDLATIESCIILYCQSNDTKDAISLIDTMEVLVYKTKTAQALCQLASSHMCLSRTFALLGQFESSRKHEKLCREVIGQMKQVMSRDRCGTFTDGGEAEKNSSFLFLHHRSAEILLQCDLVCNFLARQEELNQANHELAVCIRCMKHIAHGLSKIILLENLSACESTDSQSDGAENKIFPGEKRSRSWYVGNKDRSHWFNATREGVLLNLFQKFGLDRLCDRIDSCEGSGDTMKRACVENISHNIARIKSKASRANDSGYCIRFDRLYDLTLPLDRQEADFRPNGLLDKDFHVKLEIGSGSGEWIVEQSIHEYQNIDKNESKKVLWVSLEQRVDRVYQTYMHSMLRTEPHQLAMIAGDASTILPQLFHAGGIQEIFINHPEPPERSSGGEDRSQGKHLLTGSFFVEMHRVLRVGGTLTIVSDNRLYTNALAETVKSLCDGGDCSFESPLVGCDDDDADVVHHSNNDSSSSLSCGKINVWKGDPGKEAGHVVTGVSSYFSRLWKNGNKSRVWYLFLRKVGKSFSG